MSKTFISLEFDCKEHFEIQTQGDRVIRPKPNDRINKNHMTEYFLPNDHMIENTLGHLWYSTVICKVYKQLITNLLYFT